jgi:hypothetical protein
MAGRTEANDLPVMDHESIELHWVTGPGARGIRYFDILVPLKVVYSRLERIPVCGGTEADDVALVAQNRILLDGLT